MEENDFIQIHYIGRIQETGDVFDLTKEDVAREEDVYDENEEYGPITIIVGNSSLLPALEQKLYEMRVGDEASVSLSAEEAFGQRKRENIKKLSAKQFKKQGVNPEVNSVVQIGDQKGRVISANSGRVLVDMNHPLAGKDVRYWIRVEDKIEDDEVKLQHLMEQNLPEVNYDTNESTVTVKIAQELDETVKEQLQTALEQQIHRYTTYEHVEVTTPGATTETSHEKNV